MNLEFLGDASDHWKGALFVSLRKAMVLNDFAADTMATDQESWREEDRKLYASLLRIKQSLVIRHTTTLGYRAKYIDELAHKGDLFLDPDTGVAAGREVKDAVREVQPPRRKGAEGRKIIFSSKRDHLFPCHFGNPSSYQRLVLVDPRKP